MHGAVKALFLPILLQNLTRHAIFEPDILMQEVKTMDMLKKFFPYSFQAKKDIAALVINIIVYIVVGAVAGLLIGILAKIPVLGVIIGLVGGLVDLYVLIGLVLSVLDYLKVLK